jgi:hypothetical protein
MIPDYAGNSYTLAIFGGRVNYQRLYCRVYLPSPLAPPPFWGRGIGKRMGSGLADWEDLSANLGEFGRIGCYVKPISWCRGGSVQAGTPASHHIFNPIAWIHPCKDPPRCRLKRARVTRAGRVWVIIDWNTLPDISMYGYAYWQKDPPWRRPTHAWAMCTRTGRQGGSGVITGKTGWLEVIAPGSAPRQRDPPLRLAGTDIWY